MTPVGQPIGTRVLTRGPNAGMATHVDLLDGSTSVTRSNSAGMSATIVHRVSGLQGASQIQRLNAATLAPGIPQPGSVDSILGVPVESVRAQFIGKNFETEAYVTVVYGLVQGGGGFDNDPDDLNALPQIEILSTLQPVTTQFDVNGAVLVIDNYSKPIFDPADPQGDPIGQEPQPSQSGEVESTVDMYTIIARRRERISPGVVKAPTYTNTINADQIFGDPKHFWKCAIGGSTDDGGASWNVVYEFQRNTDTWNIVIVWRDPETGLPGAGVTRPSNMNPGSTGNGSKVAQMLPATNFRGLELLIFD